MVNVTIRKIIDLRESHDWSQKELAEKMGFNKVTMNKIEHGNRNITNENLVKFATIFQVSTDYLLTPFVTSDNTVMATNSVNIDVLLENILNGLNSEKKAYFFKNGQSLSRDDRALLQASMSQILTLSNQLAQRKTNA